MCFPTVKYDALVSCNCGKLFHCSLSTIFFLKITSCRTKISHLSSLKRSRVQLNMPARIHYNGAISNMRSDIATFPLILQIAR